MPKSNTDPSPLAIVLGTTLVVGTLSSLGWYAYYRRSLGSGSNDLDPSSYDGRRWSMNPTSDARSLIKPPFPQTLRDMLSKCKLAYLSTVDSHASSSHLSLMRFTYVHDETDGEVVIMSTNRKTKKFDMLRRQDGVALLVHDFDKAQSDAAAGGSDEASTRSITLNGNCRVLAGADEERYRKLHLEHNPDYPQFIVGEDIAVLCIDVTSARICDLNDKVVHWNVLEGKSH